MMHSDNRLKKKILADQYNSIIFEKGKGRETYLVGGYVRDIFRGIYSPDRDYIVSGNIFPFVGEIRKILRGTVVKFKKGDMIRIALNNGLTFDFSRLIDTLEEDLARRDFTINAIAWSPEKGIIDPYNGLKDIEQKKIRSISKENLISDPLRMLRAYRFAAELNGSIENKTRKAIKMLHNNIKGVSPERITLELFNLLNSDHSEKYLKMALSDGLLVGILLLPYKMLERNIKAISVLEKAPIDKIPARIKVQLDKIFSQNLTYKGLLSLELLLQNGSFTHTKVPNIKVSNAIKKRIELAHKGINEIKKTRHRLGDKVFDIFMNSKEVTTDILVIKDKLDLLKDYKRFKRIWGKGLLSTEEIISISNIATGPRLGRIIAEFKKAQFEGRVKSKKGALKFIEQLRE
jgi:tRNA nucleotidyltransferase/poly(A) polymerase